MYGNTVKLVFDIDELPYFDADARLDRSWQYISQIWRGSGFKRKMVLSDQKFDLAMKTIKKMVDESMPVEDSESKEEK